MVLGVERSQTRLRVSWFMRKEFSLKRFFFQIGNKKERVTVSEGCLWVWGLCDKQITGRTPRAEREVKTPLLLRTEAAFKMANNRVITRQCACIAYVFAGVCV